jgi:hypothetical protein
MPALRRESALRREFRNTRRCGAQQLARAPHERLISRNRTARTEPVSRRAVAMDGSECVRVDYLARPRNTVRARFSLTTSSSLSFPIRLPSRAFGTVVTLSIIKREALDSPLRSVGSISIRNSGASVGSVVNTQRVIELVESKRSSCTITAGRGFPAYGPPPDTVHTSPRFIRERDPKWH